MTPLLMQIFIEPVAYRREEVVLAGECLVTDLEQLCVQAQIRLRATAPRRCITIYSGQQQIRSPNIDYVGVPVSDLQSQDAALRALEALAHSFHDHAARACICGRGLFTG